MEQLRILILSREIFNSILLISSSPVGRWRRLAVLWRVIREEPLRKRQMQTSGLHLHCCVIISNENSSQTDRSPLKYKNIDSASVVPFLQIYIHICQKVKNQLCPVPRLFIISIKICSCQCGFASFYSHKPHVEIKSSLSSLPMVLCLTSSGACKSPFVL